MLSPLSISAPHERVPQAGRVSRCRRPGPADPSPERGGRPILRMTMCRLLRLPITLLMSVLLCQPALATIGATDALTSGTTDSATLPVDADGRHAHTRDLRYVPLTPIPYYTPPKTSADTPDAVCTFDRSALCRFADDAVLRWHALAAPADGRQLWLQTARLRL